jgi:hypothetical protein
MDRRLHRCCGNLTSRLALMRALGAEIRARVRLKTIQIDESVPGLDFPESTAEAVTRSAEAVR